MGYAINTFKASRTRKVDMHLLELSENRGFKYCAQGNHMFMGTSEKISMKEPAMTINRSMRIIYRKQYVSATL